jgi:hypothetical protein
MVDASNGAQSPALTAALHYASSWGLPVMPDWWLKDDGTCACPIGAACGRNSGKHPLLVDWPKEATTAERVIRAWWSQWPKARVGLLTGGPIAIIDVDPRNGGTESLDRLEKQYGPLPVGPRAITGGGGWHLYFRKPPEHSLRSKSGAFGAEFPGLDSRGEGGQVVAPGSDGYCWDPERDLRLPMPELPSWVFEVVNRSLNTRPNGGAEHVEERIAEGTRNGTLTSLGGSMRRRGMSEVAIGAALLATNRERCVPPLDEREVESIARSVSRYSPADVPTGGDHYPAATREQLERAAEPTLASLGDLLEPALERAARRASGVERAIPMPWPSIAEHFGGGLWPGVHFLNAGTGKGKTQLALQIALHAAQTGFPVLYVGLELEGYQIACRVLGEKAGVTWSSLYLGKAGPSYMDRAHAVVSGLRELPFCVEFGHPRGWPASRLLTLGNAFRQKYPQGDVPGSRPALVVLDFLQIIGPEPDGKGKELRERISDAAYAARDLASRLDLATLVISSIARDKYRVLANGAAEAGFVWKTDEEGSPIRRGMMNPDALVGLGKESGDIEFAGDSVSAIFRIQTEREDGEDYAFATAKGRATGASWSPLVFTGFRYEEPDDRGRRMVDALKSAKARKDESQQEAAKAKEQEQQDRDRADVVAVARLVHATPACSERLAKGCLARSEQRWRRVRAALVLGPPGKRGAVPLTLDSSVAPDFVREELGL